jgi:hypothetical protein
VAEMRRAAASPPTAEVVEKLADLVAGAKTIPLTDQIRINRRKAYALCDEIRLALRDDQPAVP